MGLTATGPMSNCLERRPNMNAQGSDLDDDWGFFCLRPAVVQLNAQCCPAKRRHRITARIRTKHSQAARDRAIRLRRVNWCR